MRTPPAEAVSPGRPTDETSATDESPAAADLTSEEPRPRLRSLDAVRGWAIVILLLAGNPFMREHLPVQLKHPQWHGLHFADLFFPLFLFVVGVAMTLSRRTGSALPVLRRAAILFAIGVALSSLKHGRLYVPGVLQHIAGSYLLAWAILRAPRRIQPWLAGGVLAAVWAAFVAFPGADGEPWDMQSTLAHTVDGWIFGHFATEGTIATVMSAVTVIGGALAGRAVQEIRDPGRLLRWVGRYALWLLVLGLIVAVVVPVNKRVWSPSFTLLTLATSAAWFALFIWVVDVRGRDRWISPLVELGANPIAVYVTFIAVRAALGDLSAPAIAPFGSETAGALGYSLLWLVAGWAFAGYLYRRRIFIKV